MRDHPLFCDEESNDEKRSRDIGYINIYRFTGSKRATLPNQWDPEQLQTIEDLYREVGPGHFELVGRDEKSKRIVDRVMITLEPPRGFTEAPQPQVPQPQPQVQQPQPSAFGMPPSMEAAGMRIPSNMDPMLGMVFTLVNAQNATNLAQLQAQREDAKNSQNSLTQLMVGFANAQSNMVVGLANAFGARPAGQSVDNTADAFVKGVEVMAALKQGINEGNGAAPGEPSKPTEWGEVAKNIATSINAIRDIAQVASVTTPGAPVVPPGAP